jgi:HD-like signal output (HDOD) protein
MKILLVDDDVRVREGLERLLFHIGDEAWEVETADSAEAAIVRLHRSPVDIVISDMRMESRSGADLLHIVHRQWPQTVRVILSGHCDEESAIRAAPHAHQYFAKPCSAELLCEVVRRTAKFRAVIQNPVLQAALGGADKLPPAPRVYQQLTTALLDPDVSVSAVSALIERDPALAAKVLQLVNSAFFAGAASISDVPRAVARLGLRTIQVAVLQAEVRRARLPPRPGLVLDTLWASAERAAETARQLAGRAIWGHEAWTAALLAPVGMLALAGSRPDSVVNVLNRTAKGEDPLTVELEELGVSQLRVTAALLSIWGLPSPVVDALSACDDPSSHDPATSSMIAAVHLSVGRAFGRPLDRAWLARTPLAADLQADAAGAAA